MRRAAAPARRLFGPTALALGLAWAGHAGAQSAAPDYPGFLFINQERILVSSETGRAILADEEAARRQMQADVREIEQAFEAEERQLTERRPGLEPDEFRALADDFDQRVIAAREEQDRRSDALAQEFDQRRRQFYASVAPILVQMMDRYGARAIFDENSVLLADQSLNVTEAVIAEIDAQVDQEPQPDAEPEPEAQPTQEPGPALQQDIPAPKPRDEGGN